MPGPAGIWSYLRLNTYRWLDKATKHGTWSKMDQDIYDFSKYFNPYIEVYKNQYEREHYLDRYNIDYSQIKQPWNLPGGSEFNLYGKTVSKTLGFVSHNVESLYEDDDPAEAKRKALMEKYYRADFRR